MDEEHIEMSPEEEALYADILVRAERLVLWMEPTSGPITEIRRHDISALAMAIFRANIEFRETEDEELAHIAQRLIYTLYLLGRHDALEGQA